MEIAILLFPRLTALDAVGPYEVLRSIPGATLRMVAADPGPQRTDHGALALVADHSLTDGPPPDVVVVPGGPGEADARRDPRVIEWVQRAHATSTWTTSVCTGSLVLGAAGLLAGKRATSHWTALDALAGFGAEPTEERVVVDGKVVTAAGVSSGIDMALWLVAQLTDVTTAESIQLAIEYDPQPPFSSGSTASASPDLVDRLRRSSRFWRD